MRAPVRWLHGGAALALALTLACRADPPRDTGGAASSSSSSAAAPAPTTKESRVYEVTSTGDLLALRSTYLKELAAGFRGRFEVHLAAGTYEPASWSLAPEPGQPPPPVELVLRGEGAVIPVPQRLSARTVRLEGLVLTGNVAASSFIEVSAALTVTGCAVIDGRTVDPNSAAPYLAVVARGEGGKKSPATLTIERSWFVRNFQQGNLPGALVGLAVHDREPGYFSQVAVRDSAFLGNAFATELALAYALDTTVERTLFYKTWPSGVFLGCEVSGRVAVKDSVLVAEDLGHVARLGEGCAPVGFEGSRIYARSYTPATALPPALRIDRAAIADRSALSATAAVVDQAVTMGLAMPPAGLRAELDRALRP